MDIADVEGFPFNEDEFVIAGPGCKRGMDFLFEGKIKYDQVLFWLRDHQDELFSDCDLNLEFSYLPEEHRRLTVMDLQNSFCELSKYYKVYTSTGRPRNKYHLSK